MCCMLQSVCCAAVSHVTSHAVYAAEEDDNPGTFPLQSERYYAALKGHGAVCRLVLLPHGQFEPAIMDDGFL